MRNSTVNAEEVKRFSRLSDQWWDYDGQFKILHQINPIRLGYIHKHLRDAGFSIKGLKVLDVGCGGGIISIPMARMEACVTGVDASKENVEIAREYAKRQGLKVDYQCVAIENLEKKAGSFDCVLALEIIEHVENPEEFIKHCAKFLKPGGLMFLSTINKNYKSLFLAKWCAEYVLRWVPKGTHDWAKFLTPAETHKIMQSADVNVIDISGMSLSILDQTWNLSSDVGMNYLMCGVKS